MRKIKVWGKASHCSNIEASLFTTAIVVKYTVQEYSYNYFYFIFFFLENCDVVSGGGGVLHSMDCGSGLCFICVFNFSVLGAYFMTFPTPHFVFSLIVNSCRKMSKKNCMRMRASEERDSLWCGGVVIDLLHLV